MSLSVSFQDSLSPSLQRLSKLFPRKAEKAIGVAALQLIQDSGSGNPTKPPIEWGYLRGSWFVMTTGLSLRFKKLAGGPKSGQIGDIGARSGVIGALFGYNADYAFYQHENLAPAGKWRPQGKGADDPTVQGKFLERPMNENAMRYAGTFARVFQEELLKG